MTDQNETTVLQGRFALQHRVMRLGETEVYLGRDLQTDRQVTVREFFCDTIMLRDENGEIRPRPGCEVQYKSLASDYEELCCYLMALPETAAAQRPYEVFWSGNTVYSVEQNTGAETLEDLLARRGRPLSWPELRRAVTPLVGLLGKMHSDGVYHRGISPETLLVSPEGTLLLTQFSIPPARTNESEIHSTLYFGYSAPEQYSSNSWQGSWSDVYSLSAVLYRALTGLTPVEWRQRGENGALRAPREINPAIPDHISQAIRTGLNVELRDRFRTVEELWCALLTEADGGTLTYALPDLHAAAPEAAARPRRELVLGVRPLVAMFLVVSLVAVFSLALAFRLADTMHSPFDAPGISQPQPTRPGESEDGPAQPGGEEPLQTKIVIPDFLGANVEKILVDPLNQRLFVFRIERVFSETAAAGTVVDQIPQAGADRQEDVLLTVSKGSEAIAMPDLTSMTLAQATERLNQDEISFTLQPVEPPSEENIADGALLGASVAVGRIVKRTTDVVTLYVAQNPPVTSQSSSSAGSSQTSGGYTYQQEVNYGSVTRRE